MLQLLESTGAVTADWGDRIVQMARVKEDMGFKALERRVLHGLKGKALADRLGPVVVKELMAYSVQQLRGKRGFGPPANVTKARRQS